MKHLDGVSKHPRALKTREDVSPHLPMRYSQFLVHNQTFHVWLPSFTPLCG